MPKLSKMLPSFSFSNFENFRELPSKDSRKFIALILTLEIREFSRISRESSKILEVTVSQGCRNGRGTLAHPTPYIFSQGHRYRGQVPTSVIFGTSSLYFQSNSFLIELVHLQYLIHSDSPVLPK